MSFKVNVKGTTEVKRKIELALRDSVRMTIMQNLGRLARDIIFKRVKSGKGVVSDQDPSTKQTTLKKLSPSYKLLRARSRLGEFGEANFSNLTFTGQMLRAIEVQARREGFSLQIARTRRSDGKLTNQEVAEYAGRVRPFFALTQTETNILLRELEKQVRLSINKALRN